MFTSGFETVTAISTAPGEGAIGIVRLSGDEAIQIADQMFKQGNKRLANVPSHTIHYGHIIDPKTEQLLDEVMVTVLRSPKTFTREDMVEINCHGGMLALKSILELALRLGARLAEPGEFTKRAFLNGRIDLTQAEAVIDLIEAKTELSKQAALRQLDGDLMHVIKDIRQVMLETLAQVEVNIDYPEYDDVEEMTLSLLASQAQKIKGHIEQLLKTAQGGKILREGLKTAIIGRPNVGKSSLLNALLREEKAIVTDIAGTTRDTIEEYVNLGGLPLQLIDTAGIRQTDDRVEQIGVERSKKALQEADFVFLILNASEPLTHLDFELLELTQAQARLILLNKTDLPMMIDQAALKTYLKADDEILMLSVLEKKGLGAIESALNERYFRGQMAEREATYLTNSRHIGLLEQALLALDEVLKGVDSSLPVDLIQIDLTRAWELLGEITGESAPDELLNQLFSQFCLGK